MMPPLQDALRIRNADHELLSLALIDSRNLTLRWLEAFEANGLDGDTRFGASPRWWAGQAGWWQDWWILRHLQRSRGEAADPASPRLASSLAGVDELLARPGPGLADAAATRAWLVDTLEATLELLDSAGDSDAELHFFRGALQHEDCIGERLAELADEWQMPDAPPAPAPWQALPARPFREPLWLPAGKARIGSAPGGWVPAGERWQHELLLPEFEIDAQPVDWGRLVEFAEDGGYDRRELWTDAGWAWLQASGRRAPRDVEQLRGGALVMRRGLACRLPARQPVMHVARHEAQAWCCWAGRRLPSEPEWEHAALSLQGRGFAWGDVFESVAGSARPWPGQAGFAGSGDLFPAPGSAGVLRGASFMTAPRQRHPRARRFVAAAADHPFCGFRSCAL